MGSGIALSRLDQTGVIVFAGEEAQNFLQGQLSCDVGGLAPENSTYGSYCTPKGRILATFLLWRSGRDFFMQLPAPLREPIQKRISMFILRARVKAADASDAFARFGIAGPGAESAIRNMLGDAPVSTHAVKHVQDATLIRLPGDRFEIVVPSEKATTVHEALKRDAEEVGPGIWDWLEIRAGIPWIMPATQEQFVPQSVNLDLIGGVSFTKGCYPGQEIVARMHYRGQVKQRMYLVHIATETTPQPGDKLYSADMRDQSCGMIVNAARAPDGGYDVLAAIQTSSVASGDVRWKTPDGPALKVLPLPYEIR
ncbi:MAG: folate-binding protein YgfZ [Betaproteobacteria bacterium]|nr:folate-binding protein YgfZ [Betaproteobacteria bacterium]